MSFEKDPIPEQDNEDLKSEDGVVALMRSSKSGEEWNANCDKVKAANGEEYPEFWLEAVTLSGVAAETQKSWKKQKSGKRGL